METIDIYEKVKDEILKSDMTIREIADKAGITDRAIQYWLKGERTMTIENAQCVLAVLGKELRVEDRN